MTSEKSSSAASVQAARALSICSTLPDVELTHPFRPSTAVFKISGKIFAALGALEEPNRLTLKCDPDYGTLLRHQFDQISPGYHMNKHHWITIALDASVSTDLICELIVDSYDLVAGARAIHQ